MQTSAPLPAVPAGALNLSVNHCGIYVCESDWSIEPRSIRDCDLFYIEHGAGWMTMNGTRYDAGPGDLFIILPGITHSAGHTAGSPLTVHAMHFSAQLYGLWELHEVHRLPEKLPVPAASPLPGLLKAGITETLTDAAYGIPAAEAYLQLILIEILRLTGEALPATGVPEASPRVLDIAAFINAHLGERITLDSLAAGTNMSTSLLQKTTRNGTGLSPLNLANRIKVNAARMLLEQDGQTVAATAAALGYDDDAYFSRVFRKHTGLSPKQYQRDIRREII